MNELNNNTNNSDLMDIPVTPSTDADVTQVIEEQPLPVDSQEVEVLTENPNQSINAIENLGEPLSRENENLSISQVSESNNIQPEVQVTQINSQPIKNEAETEFIPETMDLNYGVIPSNNSETVIKQNINKNNTKTIIGIVIGALVIILLVVGFLAYKFYFSIDPVSLFTTKIKEFGQMADNTYKNAPEINFIKNNDKLKFVNDIDASLDYAGQNYKIDMAYNMTILKGDDKVYADVVTDFNGVNLLNMSATIFKNSLFIKVLESGRNFRAYTDNSSMFENLEEQINKLADAKLVSPYTNYIADAIENNISKDDFEISVTKTDVNGKSVSVNKYNLKITNEIFTNIVKDFIKGLKNDPLLSENLQNFDINEIETDFEETTLNIYASLSGVIKVELLPNTGSITYTKIDDNKSNVIANNGLTDIIVVDIVNNKTNTNIKANIDIEGSKVVANFDISNDGKIKGSIQFGKISATLDMQATYVNDEDKISTETTLKLTVSAPEMLDNDIVVNLKSKAAIESNEDLIVPMPNGAINIDTAEGEELFLNDLKQTGIYSLIEQFMVSNQLMQSADENADHFESFDDTYYEDEI